MAGELTNVEDAQQLIRYAARSRLEQLHAQRGLTQGNIAEALGRDKGHLSKTLKEPNDQLLQRLDEAILAMAPELAETGSLSGLATRLRRTGTRANLVARIPPTWTGELLAKDPRDEFDVLLQASAILSMFQAAPEQARQVAERHADQLESVVQRLILIGASPPTARNVEALILLGSIASYAFDVVAHHLEAALEQPLGFRVWRAVTATVMLSADSDHAASYLKDWIRARLEAADTLRDLSLFPARSLDLELAIVVPTDWSPRDDDWAGQVLRTRAENAQSTVRERGTAALGLWERSVNGGRTDVEPYLRSLVDQYKSEAEQGDVAVGLRWVAATLEHNLNTKEAVCNTWPDTDQPCLDVVRDAVAPLAEKREGIPERILGPTMKLVEHAVLQNSGVHRRQAIETLQAGGWIVPVIQAMDRVLRHPKAEAWLRCRALFALGYLQDRSPTAEQVLTRACTEAKRRLDESVRSSSRGASSEAHAALFAIGDSFGIAGAQAQARRVRRRLGGVLQDVLEWRDPDQYRVTRAAAYVVMVTAETDEEVSKVLLESVGDHPDQATRDLAIWALRHRFDENGNVRPLHAAI